MNLWEKENFKSFRKKNHRAHIILCLFKSLVSSGQIQILHLPQTPKCGKKIAESTGNKGDNSQALCRELKCFCSHMQTETNSCFGELEAPSFWPAWVVHKGTMGSLWKKLFSMNKEHKIILQHTNFFELRTTPVCSFVLSHIGIPITEIIISPSNQTNNFMWKLSAGHYRPFKDNTLITHMSLGSVTKLLFFIVQTPNHRG